MAKSAASRRRRDARAVLVPRRPAPRATSCGALRGLVRAYGPARGRRGLVDPRAEVGRRERREGRAAGCRGRPSDRWRSPGCRRSRPPRAATMPRPVLPLPVMPTNTACVVRSLRRRGAASSVTPAGGRVAPRGRGRTRRASRRCRSTALPPGGQASRGRRGKQAEGGPCGSRQARGEGKLAPPWQSARDTVPAEQSGGVACRSEGACRRIERGRSFGRPA